MTYKRRATGEGDTFWEQKRTRVIYAECGGTMAAYSLLHHMERSHGTVLPHKRGLEVGQGGMETYMMSFTRVLRSVECPVDICPERENNPGRLMEHFMC